MDDLTNIQSVCDGMACSKCTGCLSEEGYTYDEYLFDVEADPRETKNLIDAHPEVRGAVLYGPQGWDHHSSEGVPISCGVHF